jgi:UDP-glucose 4-epimerase
MNVLITGGAGFIGSSIAREYIKHGHSVVLVDDLWSGRESNLPRNSIFYKLDIRSDQVNEICDEHKIELINHQAARGDVRQSLKIPEEYADVNIIGGLKLLEIARKKNMRGIIYSSTGGCVYGEPEYVPTDEKHIVQPVDPYGTSKACFETYVQSYKRLYGLDYVIFRYPNVYGPRQNPFGEAGVISIFTSLMLKNNEVIINGDGNQERDYLYIDDVVNANLHALEKLDSNIYNLGTSIPTNVNEIFEKIKNIIGYKKDPIYGSIKDGEVTRSYLSYKKIKNNWSWSPSTSIDEGLKNTVKYIKDNEV